MVTTHFGRLKAASESEEGFCNASMEFDSKELRPTYAFIQGLPGSSYALEIAERVGLAARLIQSARDILGDQGATVEDLILKLEKTQQETAAVQQRLDDELAEAEQMRTALEVRLASSDQEAREIKNRALAESQRLLKESRARIENTIRVIRETEADKQATRRVRKELEDFAGEIENARTTVERPSRHKEQKAASVVSVGDRVVIDGGSASGEVLSISRGKATIAAGTGKVTVKLDRIRKVGGRREQQVHVKTVGTTSSLPSSAASTSIDLRGKRVDEALSEVVPFVDRAVAANLNEASIIHGTGTGALRSAIREYLSTRPDVSGFGDADYDSGGPGVTIVTLS